MPSPARILMVVTSHGDIGGKPTTGIWFTEFSEPFAAFMASGAQETVSSPRGGPAPIDPRGYPSRDEIASVRDALAALNATVHLSDVEAEDFDGLFFPGGHGPMFDLAVDPAAKALIAAFWAAQKPVAAVCHGPAALLDVDLGLGKNGNRGQPFRGIAAAKRACRNRRVAGDGAEPRIRRGNCASAPWPS